MTMARRKVTVFGGTGFLGQRVVQHLLERDFSVRVAARHPERIAALIPDVQLDAILADVNDDRSVAAAVAGVEGVVNAVSLYAESRPRTFHSVHVEAATRVARLREKRASGGSSTCPALAPMPDPPRRISAVVGEEKKLFARFFPVRRSSVPPSCSGEATPS
jgi:nucleoside-diphosphate-sugar epimerase